MRGKVMFYNVKKGYGFIRGKDGSRAFVHKSEIPFWTIYLTEGDTVEYEPFPTAKGLTAKDVTVIKEAKPRGEKP